VSEGRIGMLLTFTITPNYLTIIQHIMLSVLWADYDFWS